MVLDEEDSISSGSRSAVLSSLDSYRRQSFPGSDGIDLEQLRAELQASLADMRRRSLSSPTNSIQNGGRVSVFDRLHSERERMEKKKINKAMSMQKEEEKEYTFRPKINVRKYPPGGRRKSLNSDCEDANPASVDDHNYGSIPEHDNEEDTPSHSNASHSHDKADEEVQIESDSEFSPECDMQQETMCDSELIHENKGIPDSSVLNETFKKLQEAHNALHY
mmetsp:Transcript_59383/g.88183  ORF Transcript_59383/g.88183 Transcript_59383/m.88183 type:complete len:221 (+) Transcript_59383:115-777(+)